jgi:hypothetical protein
MMGGHDQKVCVAARDTSGVKFVWLSILLLCEKASGAARSASSTTARLPSGSFQRPRLVAARVQVQGVHRVVAGVIAMTTVRVGWSSAATRSAGVAQAAAPARARPARSRKATSARSWGSSAARS